MKTTKNIRRVQLCVILSMATSYGLPAISEGGETCPTNSSGPEICVSFDGDTPVENINFAVDYMTDPANPSVTLKTGNLTWNVRSRVGPPPNDTPANMGAVKIDPTAVDDFEVSILNGTGPGAVNVGGINLDLAPSADGNFSNLSGANITGTLSGTTRLQRSSGGEGGNVTGAVTIDTLAGVCMSISGDVLEPMTITTVSSLIGVGITGNLGTSAKSADLTITTHAGPGAITISGPGINYGDITVGSLEASLSVYGTVPIGHTMDINMKVDGRLTVLNLAGTLELPNGSPSDCCTTGLEPYAIIHVITLTSTGVIDLKGAAMRGVLTTDRAHTGSRIINGGEVTGFFYPGITALSFFNGTLTVASVSETSTHPDISTGEIEAVPFAAVNGIINVTGTNAGSIEVGGAFTGQINVGSVADSGLIETAEDASGNIVVSGACAGAIVIEGDLSGTVDIGGISGAGLTSTGSVTVDGALKAVGFTGGKILVDGLCDGLIKIGKQTDDGTLIHLVDGLDAHGSIEINTTKVIFNADGDIKVGPAGVLTDIVFDGCIHIYDNGALGGGALNGTLTVRGCHDTTDDLDICIDGPDNNNVKIEQTGCTNQVDWSCPTPACP